MSDTHLLLIGVAGIFQACALIHLYDACLRSILLSCPFVGLTAATIVGENLC